MNARWGGLVGFKYHGRPVPPKHWKVKWKRYTLMTSTILGALMDASVMHGFYKHKLMSNLKGAVQPV